MSDNQSADGGFYFSPPSTASFDEYSIDPRFLELQEELRDVLFAGLSGPAPDKDSSPDKDSTPSSSGKTSTSGKLDGTEVVLAHLDFSGVAIAKMKLIGYLSNWVVECAPHLDKFDDECHFGIQVPLIAQTCPPLLYAMLAFSARQMERVTFPEYKYDSLELYQESIHLLGPGLQAKDPNMLATACILAVMELMSGSDRTWRRHIEGCASLLQYFQVNGFSGGLLQAVFWCYARMELYGVMISDGLEGTVLHLDKWVPHIPEELVTEEAAENFVREAFHQQSRNKPGMHSNWAVYLCAKVCDLIYRRTRHIEGDKPDDSDSRTFTEQWTRLWADLQFWLETRPTAMLPVKVVEIGVEDGQLFPTILFAHWPAISGNQLYHTACIRMLAIQAPGQSLPASHSSAVWHAHRICGISWSNPHRGSLINAIQPLYVAGRLLSHPDEHLEVARILKLIDRITGWGALWRVRDLELEWGYEPGEILNAI
ncbi:hypothetical protein G7046_g3287 [Stylonectria norvegica]|nr:hypothetical protein G7046_g3287 [Stylonectria norvegica]